MYILHVPLLWWYKRSGWRLFGRIGDVPAAFLYIALVTTLSAAAYALIEEPAHRRLRNWFKRVI